MRLILLVLVVACVIDAVIEPKDLLRAQLKGFNRRLQQFRNFALRFNRNFDNLTDAQSRYEVFTENMELIENANLANLAKFQPNEFVDRTEEELRKLVMPVLQRPNTVPNSAPMGNTVLELDVNPPSVPNEMNWVTSGHVTPIKNQGGCGSCYSFATIAALESMYSIKGQGLHTFSEQQIVDCSPYTAGCYGGWMSEAFRYLQQNNSETSSMYPYRGTAGNCAYSKPAATIRISGYKMLQSEDALKTWVGSQGPAAIAIYVPKSFFYYKSGVMVPNNNECNEHTNSGGHAMAVVGYGTEGGVDYWLLKNSWGPTFGENGYVKFARGVDACGIISYGGYGNSAPFL